MKSFQTILFLLTALTASLLASCYVSLAMWSWVILTCITGMVWISGQFYQWRWTGYAGMICFLIISSRGIFLDIPSALLLLIVVLTLAIWDMNMFFLRINHAGQVEKRRYLVRCHCKKLAASACTGFILGASALKLDITIAFGWLILLGIVLVLLMSRLIRTLISRTGQGGLF